MRRALVFPGYPYSCEDDRYPEVIEIYRERGFEVEKAGIEWNKSLEENLDRADDIMQDFYTEEDEIHVFGHSWGAVCALWASRSYDLNSILLASMTPEFVEDRENRNFMLNFCYVVSRSLTSFFGRPGSQDLDISLSEFEQIRADHIRLFYGEKEYRWFRGLRYLSIGRRTAEKRLEYLPSSSQEVIEGAGHMLNDNYLEAIEDCVATLD